MPLTLATIYKSKGVKKSKRVGRGNGSGHGTYSCRGLKGQKSRSGASGLTRLGMRKMLLATPKLRGFKSLNQPNQVVDSAVINKNFRAGELVSPKTLLKKGLITTTESPVKILGKTELNDGLILKGVKISQRKVREKTQPVR